MDVKLKLVMLGKKSAFITRILWNHGCCCCIQGRAGLNFWFFKPRHDQARLSVLDWGCIKVQFSVHCYLSLYWRFCLESLEKAYLWSCCLQMILFWLQEQKNCWWKSYGNWKRAWKWRVWEWKTKVMSCQMCRGQTEDLAYEFICLEESTIINECNIMDIFCANTCATFNKHSINGMRSSSSSSSPFIFETFITKIMKIIEVACAAQHNKINFTIL